MIIQDITLRNFRNYREMTLLPHEGVNLFFGANGSGKTNLLEAVCLLSTGKSFRTRYDRELLGFDYSSANILADIESHGRQQNISIDISSGKPKRIVVNGVKKTASELCETLNVVLFCPEDLNIIKGAPAERRKFLNVMMSKVSPSYYNILSVIG